MVVIVDSSLCRRALLRCAVGLVGVVALATACTPAPTSAPSTAAPGVAAKPAGAGKQVALPTYQPPPSLPTPDFPGSADGVVAPGFVNWPKTTFSSAKQAPGDGSDVSIFLNIPGAPPPLLDQNPAWQAW